MILPRTSEALFLVQRVRDEAHRFAITFQRQRRSTSIASQLAEVPGLGPKRVRALLRHFGSVARLRVATEAEIAGAPGVGPQLAEVIHRHLGRAAADNDRAEYPDDAAAKLDVESEHNQDKGIER